MSEPEPGRFLSLWIVPAVVCGLALSASCGRRNQDAPGPSSDEPVAIELQHLTRAQYQATVEDLIPAAPANIADAFSYVDPHTGETRDVEALPEDDQVDGIEIGTAMSAFLPERYFDRAEALTALTTEDWGEVVPCDLGEGRPCATQFIEDFGLRAFRRPPSDEEIDALLASFDDAVREIDLEAGFEVVLFSMLTSPRFLYRLEISPTDAGPGEIVALDDYEMATRLSYFLTGSMPDEELFAAAAAGELSNADQVRAQAERLMGSQAGVQGIREFLRQWAELDHISALRKDVALQPDFEPSLGPDLRASLEHALADLAESPDTTVSDLFFMDDFYVNERLAAMYDVEGAFGDTLEAVWQPERIGVIAHPGLLALHSKNEETQLVARGRYVSERILCRKVPPPPPDVPLDLPPVDERDPPRNMRERFSRHVANPSCASCHNLMDPIGFGFESYDGLGRFRTEDLYGPVDPSGELVNADEANGPFADFDELNAMLADSRVARECLAQRMYGVALGRPVSTRTDATDLQEIWTAADARLWRIRELAIELTTTTPFRTRVVR